MNYSKIWVAFKISLAISLGACALAPVASSHKFSPRTRLDTSEKQEGATSAGVFPTWGNLTIADCYFAAVANWEMLALRFTPGEAAVESAFIRAGGSPVNGIEATKAERWLHREGIEGLRLKFKWVLYPSRRRLKRWVRHYRNFLASWGDHEILVDGAYPGGFGYITWGEQRYMTWHEGVEDFFEITAVSVYA